MSFNRDELCGQCGQSPCVWDVSEMSLLAKATRLQGRLSRRPRQNKALRKTLGRIFIYLQTGQMKGTLPTCMHSNMLKLWPDTRKKVRTETTA
eukprot:jgi/Phyca11/109701/e_gw1.17.651.1